MIHRIVIMLLTATYISAWPVWILGCWRQIGVVRLLLIVMIGYAAWICKYYLLWKEEQTC